MAPIMVFRCSAVLRRVLLSSCAAYMYALLAVLLPGTMMLGQTATTTTLAVSPVAPSLAPQTVVTLTATVTAGSTPVHPGRVTFCEATAAPCTGLAVVGTAQLLSDGTATLRLIPGAGTHSYIAVFAGTTTPLYTTSTSPSESVTVFPWPTTTDLFASGSVGDYTLTATVVTTGSFKAPTGDVKFEDQTTGNNLGIAPLGGATLGQTFVNAPGSPVAVGTEPFAVAMGDFNGDGIADLAVVNYFSNTVSILLGNGSGGFTEVLPRVAVGNDPFAVAVGDFNGDGKLDLAVVNYGDDNVTILLGNGSGGFTEVLPRVAVGSYPAALAVGDFNGDGNLDLAVVTSGDDNVTILLGNGSGGFTEVLPRVAVGGGPRAVVVGDFNGDGKLDLVVANYGSANVSILLGNGSGGFTEVLPRVAVVNGPWASSVAVGDFNGDGIADLAVANGFSDNVSILLGNGSGSFTEVLPRIAVGVFSFAVAVGDFNGDGKLDLAVANYGSANVSILLGNGSGGFTEVLPRVAVGNNPLAVAVGDFNGDGIADLAAVTSGDDNVTILLNQVTQTATAELTGVSVTPAGTHLVNANYTGDEIFSGSSSPNISLEGSVVVSPTTTTLVASPPSSPGSPLAAQTMVTLTATVTADGTLVSPGLVTFCNATPCTGLAVVGTAQLLSDGTATLRLIPGAGTHSYIAVFAGTALHTGSTSTPQSVTVALPTTHPTTTSIASSGSPGNYTLTATVVGIGNATAGLTGDVSFIDTTNGNNVLGTATLGPSTAGRSFAIAPGSPITVGSAPRAVAVEDFNGDGIADLAVANRDSGDVSILLGNRSGGFAPAPGSPVAVGTGSVFVVVGDFNGDGIADLAVVNVGSNNVSILLGNGNGGFAPAPGSPVAVGTNPYAVAVGYFTNSGHADLAVVNAGSNNVSILLGNGDGTFRSAASVAVGTAPQAVAVGDFNGDGITDLAVANVGSNNVSILLGDGNGGFAPAPGSPIAAGTNPYAVAVGYFTNSGHADLAVVNVGSNNVSILLGNGSGGFAPATGSPVAVGTNPYAVTVGDFNGDGIADLAVSNSGSGDVSILLGDGSGGFAPAPGSPVAVGAGPVFVAVGDFNGDGMTDLVVANSSSVGAVYTVSILLNQVTQTATAVLTGVSVTGSGTHDVKATYPGDTNYTGSTSSTTPLTGTQVATATTLLLSTADIIEVGTTVTLTASVTPFTAGSLTATGTISFHDGATLLGTATISPTTGEASLTVPSGTIPAFALGTHSLTAVYSGDTNFITSTSAPVSLTVEPLVAVALASSLNPSPYGQAVTFTATVPSGATGTIQFLNGTVNLGGPVAIVGTTAAITLSTLTQGLHPITAAYSGDGTHAPATSGVLEQLVTHAVLTVTATSSTRVFNQPNGTLSYTITGFVGSDTQAGSVTGAPTLLTTAIETSPVGTYPIVIGLGTLAAANYSFVFVNGSLTVTKATPGAGVTAAIALTSSINPSTRGESVTFTAMLPALATGQVTFMNGTVVLGTAPILGDAASFSTSQLVLGTHPITAVYAGDTNYNGATSAVLDQVVNRTTLQITASDAQRVFGQSNPAFTTAITGFVDGDTPAVVTGTPTVATTATPTSPVGVYPITVAQGTLAAANYIFAFLNGRLTVTPATPGVGPTAAITIDSSHNPAPLGGDVTFTSTVPTGATGTVSFFDGTTLLGTATITGNTASLTVSTLALGAHTITAVYSGDTNFTTASSAVLALVVVTTADFTVASSTGRQLIPPGASANFTIVVSPMNGPFTSPVTMSASNLPPGATYTFSPAAATPGAAGTNTTFTVSVPHQSSMASRGRRLGPVAFALLLLPFAYVKRHRRRPQQLLLWMLVALTSFGAVSGCGAGGYFSQTEQTYTITVTGTSGALVRSTTVTLTVQ